jgi:hypothetical protein
LSNTQKDKKEIQMKRASFALLVVVLALASAAMIKRRKTPKKE